MKFREHFLKVTKTFLKNVLNLKIFRFLKLPYFWISIVISAFLLIFLWKIFFVYLANYTRHGEEIIIPEIQQLDLKEALNQLEQYQLEYEVDTTAFDPKYKPYQVIKIYPPVNSTVKKGRKIFIQANAKTWKPVTVPDIINTSKYLAFSKLNLVHLKVGDTIYEPNLAENIILKMSHKGKFLKSGDILPRFSKIDLVIGKKLSKKTVRSLIGLKQEEAIKLISDDLFMVGNITYENVTDRETATVFYQVPSPYSTYDQGLLVDIWLSNKPISELKGKIKELDFIYNKSTKFYNNPFPSDNTDNIIDIENNSNNGNNSNNIDNTIPNNEVKFE